MGLREKYFEMIKLIKTVFLVVAVVCVNSCTEVSDKKSDPYDIVHQNVDQLTRIIIYDVFSPPVASRIYAYASLAQYEVLRLSDTSLPSFSDKLNGFPRLPEMEPNANIDYRLAATEAFLNVAGRMIFAKDTLANYRKTVEQQFKETLSPETFKLSVAFGNAVGDSIFSRTKVDMYKETRGMAKYLGKQTAGFWRPTSPDYLDGTEPYWKMIRPFFLTSVAQFRPQAPAKFDTSANSPFFATVREVYEKSINLTEDEKVIAKYWDDNPFVMEHSGHTMFGNKKITPGGHWIGITTIACRKVGASPAESALAYSLVSMSLLDAFISCWEAKYAYEYVRPITVINDHIQRGWTSFLQTPPFPEYTSGHSTISGASATVLTSLFGDQFSFHDNSDSLYIGMVRDFTSFQAAAEEASISRLLGGIHYRPSLDSGLNAGRNIGRFAVEKLGVRKLH